MITKILYLTCTIRLIENIFPEWLMTKFCMKEAKNMKELLGWSSQIWLWRL